MVEKKRVKKKRRKKVVRRKATLISPEDEKPRFDGGIMGFMGHLREFKTHLVRMVLAVGLVTALSFSLGVAWTRWTTPLGFPLPYPYLTLENNIATLLFNKIRADLLPMDVELVMIKPIDAILVNFQIALFIGVSIGMIAIIKEMGAFISPALKAHEKRIVLRAFIPTLLLFFSGCAFSYFYITPFTLKFLYAFGSNMNVVKFLSIDEFISFILVMVLGMGLVFEMPMIMATVSWTGLVSPDFWAKHWRIALVIMIIIAGVITPDTTGITQMIVVVPMGILYVLGYAVSRRIVKKKREGDTEYKDVEIIG